MELENMNPISKGNLSARVMNDLMRNMNIAAIYQGIKEGLRAGMYWQDGYATVKINGKMHVFERVMTGEDPIIADLTNRYVAYADRMYKELQAKD